ncbi:heme exporter protein CcmD [Reinekea sp.]
MGGHGFYVWLAYAIGAGIFLFNVLSPILYRKKLVKDNQRRLRREQS